VIDDRASRCAAFARRLMVDVAVPSPGFDLIHSIAMVEPLGSGAAATTQQHADQGARHRGRHRLREHGSDFEVLITTKSTGMGALICRLIIEGHGERLWASATIPHGFDFHLVLPIGDARTD
jgi:hypothetical protein